MKSSRSIALCTEIMYPVYGVEKRVYEMARRLPKYGFDVTVYTSSRQSELPDIDIRQVSQKTIERQPQRNYINCLGFWVNLYRELLKNDHDIIDANGHLSLLPCSMAARRVKKPVVATIHDLYLNQWFNMYRGLGAFFGLPFEVLISRLRYDRVLTLNSTIKKRMINVMGMDESRISVIPSGIDVKYIDRVKGGKKDEKTVLYVGRLVPQKNVDVLIRACAGVDANLRIVGSGSELGKLMDLAKKTGVDGRTSFLGRLERGSDVIREMRRATVLVLPSIRECFGIIPLEAMYCGTAVISTATEGPMDYIKSGWNGFLTGIGNVSGLGEKIDIVLSDSRLRKRIERNGRKTAREYDWDNIIKRIAGVYKELEG